MTDQQPNPSEDEVYASCRMLLLQRVQQEDHEALKEALTVCVGLIGVSRTETLVLEEVCPQIEDFRLSVWLLAISTFLREPTEDEKAGLKSAIAKLKEVGIDWPLGADTGWHF